MTVKTGGIFKFYYTRPTVADILVDVEDDDEWAARLDQADPIPGSGAAPIRQLSVIGSMPAGEVTDVDLPLNQVFSIKGNTVLTMRCYDLSPENLAACKTYNDAGTTRQKAWWAFSDQIVGGNTGVNGGLRMNPIVEEGKNTLAYIEITFTFSGSINSIVTSPLPAFASY
jgi:hypothetical protein